MKHDNLRWIPLELHCHTCHSDGAMTVEELTAEADRLELEAFALTDHNTAAGLRECGDHVIPGIEWTTYHGHMCVLGAREFVEWRDLSSDNIDQKLREIRKAGGIVGVAHPFRLGNPVCTGCHWEYEIKDFDLLNYWEVWSLPDAPLRKSNQRSVEAWAALLDKGHRIAPSCGHDWHRPDREKRPAVTYLAISGDYTPQKAIEALRQGRSLLTMGPVPMVEARTAGDPCVYTIGDTMAPGDCTIGVTLNSSIRKNVWKDYGITVDAVQVIGTGNRVVASVPIKEGTPVNFQLSAEPGWLRVEVLGKLGEEGCVIAMTGAIYVQEKTMITAHSGAEKTPPNSLAFVRHAIALGCDGLEVDVRGGDDGLYMAHDMHEGAEHAALADCFALLAKADCIRINCDMKEPGLVRETVELARAHGIVSRLLFTGNVTKEELCYLADTEAEGWYNLPEHLCTGKNEDAIAALEALLPAKPKVLNMPLGIVSRDMVEALEERDYGISAWTANTKEDIEKLLSAGVANITTNAPSLAMEMRKDRD